MRVVVTWWGLVQEEASGYLALKSELPQIIAAMA